MEDDGSFIWIKEGEPVYKIESTEAIAQKIRFLRLQDQKPIPSKSVLQKAALCIRTLEHAESLRAREQIAISQEWVDLGVFGNEVPTEENLTKAYENWKGKRKAAGTFEGVEIDKLRGDDIDTIQAIFTYLIPDGKQNRSEWVSGLFKDPLKEADRWYEELEEARKKWRIAFGSKFGVNPNGVIKRLWMDNLGRMYTIADYRYIYYVEDKEGEDLTENWKRMEDLEKRREAAEIRRPDSYVQRILEEAAKKVTGDEGYEMGYNEMCVMKNAIKYIQSAREKTFKRRMDILAEFCRMDELDPEKIPEDETLRADRITEIGLSDEEEEVQVEDDYILSNDDKTPEVQVPSSSSSSSSDSDPPTNVSASTPKTTGAAALAIAGKKDGPSRKRRRMGR